MKTKEQVQATIAKLNKALTKAQSELAACEPELRHGDVRKGHIFLEEYGHLGDKKRKGRVAWDCGLSDYQGRERMAEIGPTDFNLFDYVRDLASLSEPLERTGYITGKNQDGTINGNLMGYGVDIFVGDDEGDSLVELRLEQAIEFHRNLGRLVATAKKRAAE